MKVVTSGDVRWMEFCVKPAQFTRKFQVEELRARRRETLGEAHMVLGVKSIRIMQSRDSHGNPYISSS